MKTFLTLLVIVFISEIGSEHVYGQENVGDIGDNSIYDGRFFGRFGGSSDDFNGGLDSEAEQDLEYEALLRGTRRQGPPGMQGVQMPQGIHAPVNMQQTNMMGPPPPPPPPPPPKKKKPKRKPTGFAPGPMELNIGSTGHKNSYSFKDGWNFH